MERANQNREFIQEVRRAYLSGSIDLDEAKRRAQPTIDEMNKKGAEIAKQYGKKFKPFTLNYLFR